MKDRKKIEWKDKGKSRRHRKLVNEAADLFRRVNLQSLIRGKRPDQEVISSPGSEKVKV